MHVVCCMIRDLVRMAVDMIKQEQIEVVRAKAEQNVEEKILDILLPPLKRQAEATTEADINRFQDTREKFRAQLKAGVLDERIVEIEEEK